MPTKKAPKPDPQAAPLYFTVVQAGAMCCNITFFSDAAKTVPVAPVVSGNFALLTSGPKLVSQVVQGNGTQIRQCYDANLVGLRWRVFAGQSGAISKVGGVVVKGTGVFGE